MKRVILLSLMAVAETPQELFQKGLVKERSDGKLDEAMQLYRRAAEVAGKDRALAAKALVQLAACYEKLGNLESRKIYERVVREYVDQKEAVAIARTRLGVDGEARNVGPAARRRWTLPSRGVIYSGTVTQDGRHVAYVDWAQEHHGDLFLHDFVTGADRRLTNTAGPGSPSPEDQFAEEYSFSRDGKQLVYTWFDGKKDRYELRILNLQGTGIPQFRRLFDNEDIFWIAPYDWSPDGRLIAVSLHRRDRTAQIGLVTVRDGSLRVLKFFDWRGPSKMIFSLDGKYLAYDLAAKEAGVQRDVFVMAIDGSREIPAVTHPANDAVVGWSPDGKRLLFSSDRTGSTGLWATRFEEGKTPGQPELLKRDIGELSALSVTASGAIYLAAQNPRGSDIQVATFDFDTGKFLSSPVQAVQTFVGSNHAPDWSPDGKYLAYVSSRGAGGVSSFPVIGIRSVETGEVRELSPPLESIGGGFSWAPDGGSFIVGGRDLKGRLGIFKIELTGQPSILVHRERSAAILPELSPNGKTLFFRINITGEFSFMRRDLASGNEIELIRRPRLGRPNLSPDGQYLAAATFDPSEKSSSLLLIPSSGGPSRELMRVNQVGGVGVHMWASDSSAIFARRSLPGGKEELWRVPIDGGQPKKLDGNLDSKVGRFRLHPDGRQVAFETTEQGPQTAEVWVLENVTRSLKSGQ